jgi:hypothetical protein
MYYVQTKVPAGNFVDYAGIAILANAVSTTEYIRQFYPAVRIVERQDIVILDEENVWQK